MAYDPNLADFVIELPNWRQELGLEEDFNDAYDPRYDDKDFVPFVEYQSLQERLSAVEDEF
jgi:hypothetical protein